MTSIPKLSSQIIFSERTELKRSEEDGSHAPPSASGIDRSPCLKPSEFWGIQAPRMACAACAAKAQGDPNALNSPAHKPISAVWWQPTTNEKDLYFMRKNDQPFIFAHKINQFFDGKLNLPDMQKIITPSNAREFLNELKIIELMRHQKRTKGSDLPRSTRLLREICAIKSGGTLSTAEVFLKTTDPRYCEPRDEFSYRASANPDNLIPERVAEIARYTCTHAIKILSLSRKMKSMGLEQPTTVILRGNYGAGKSKLSAQFVPDQETIPSPDSFKADLRKGTRLTNQQLQKEGTKNFQKLMYELRLKGVSTNFIFDEALRKKDQVEEILDTAATTGSHVVFREIDVPLMISCLRVLSRDIETSPCMPFNQIADAFEGFRKERKKWLEQIQIDRTVADFQLLATSESDPSKNGVVAIEKNGSSPRSFVRIASIEAFLGNEPLLFDQAVHFDPREIAAVRNTIITHDLIEKYEKWGGIKTDVLKSYLGSTVEKALHDRSLEIPIVPT